MKRIYFILSVVSALISTNISAQESLISINWNVNFPTSDTKDFLSSENVSLAGASVDYRVVVNEKMTVGAYFAWDFFNGSTRELRNIEGNDISGLKRLYLNYIPVMLNTHYYFKGVENISPYVGAGMGAVRTLQRADIGTFSIQNNNWHFGFYPEIGATIPLTEEIGVIIGAQYNYAVATSDSIDYSFFSIKLGVLGLW